MADCMQDVRARMLDEGTPYMLPRAEQRSITALVNDGADPDLPADLPLVDISCADDGAVVLILPAEQMYDALSQVL
eukprot:1275788-Pyramimonas_sp.AAC.1